MSNSIKRVFCWLPTKVNQSRYWQDGFRWLSWAYENGDGIKYSTHRYAEHAADTRPVKITVGPFDRVQFTVFGGGGGGSKGAAGRHDTDPLSPGEPSSFCVYTDPQWSQQEEGLTMNEQVKGCVNCGADDHDTKDCKRLPIAYGQLDPQRRLDVARGVDDSARLPVVAYRYTSGARIGGKWHHQESFPKWDDRKVSEVGQLEELCRLTDAQALLAEKDAEVAKWKALAESMQGIAEIAQSGQERMEKLRAHIRTDNTETLANALAEVERLKGIRDHLRMQASIQAQEARTQKSTVMEIGKLVDCDQDFLVAGAVRARLEQLQAAPAARGVVLPDDDELMQMAFEIGEPCDDATGYWFSMEQWDEFTRALRESLNPAPATADSDVREVK